MWIGRTLFRHIGTRLAKAILLSFLVFVLLLAIIDFTQLARWIGTSGLDLKAAIIVSALRAPGLAESVLPFAVLFGAIATFVQLNRRLELTVTRAAGVSAWQVLLPAVVVAFVLGLVAVTLYNPAATALRELSVSIGGFGGGTGFRDGEPVWLRQNGDDGPSIIGALRTADQGTLLAGVTAFLFAEDGGYRLRIDAPQARLVGQDWVFADPVVTETGLPATRPEEYRIHTHLTLAQIKESIADPATVAFWRLPGLIEIASATGLPATDLKMRFNGLLSMPMLLVAMVLIAAVVSLRFSRTLGLGRPFVAGATSGFVLYVVLVVSADLGRGGVVAPAIAAWAPVVLATLVSVTVLMREEDG